MSTQLSFGPNRNVMCNDLTALPWAADQLHIAENYWEAVGVLAAMKAGIAPESVRRPLSALKVSTRTIRPEPIEQPDPAAQYGVRSPR